MKRVSVTVPATAANLGPGFDCLGLALGLYNRVIFTETATGLHLTVHGEGKEIIPVDSRNLVLQAAERVFRRAGRRPTGLRIRQEDNIPVGSGLGSSAAAVVGGMLAANTLLDNPLEPDELLWLATQLEGHPDNVAPALLGGLVLINQEQDRLLLESITVPTMQVLIVLPKFHLPTAEARAALPRQVPLSDAVFNVSRLALLIRALEAGDFDKLGVAMQDRLHQPYRLPLIPGMEAAFVAAREAGAAAVALSGAGPSIIIFAADGHEMIGQAVAAAFATAGLQSRVWKLPIDVQGSHLSNPI